MYMRFVRLAVKPDRRQHFSRFYDEHVVPTLRKVPGCLYVGLINDYSTKRKFISLTLWQKPEDAAAYEKSGLYRELLDANKDFLLESTEWKVQLSEDLTLEYMPVEHEPEVETFNVTASTAEADPGELSSMYLRIVSATVQTDRFREFKSLYVDEIIPMLQKESGFRHAFLVESTEHPNEVLSVTIWDSKDAADTYEKSGNFDVAVAATKPMLSSLFQWKLALEPSEKDHVVTSDDLRVQGFQIVTGDG
jgi:heme-degrading monooxygenase HmoA